MWPEIKLQEAQQLNLQVLGKKREKKMLRVTLIYYMI